jgi:hypothetical protein
MFRRTPLYVVPIIAVLMIACSGFAAVSPTVSSGYVPGFRPGEVVITLKPGTTLDDAIAVAESMNAIIIDSLPSCDTYLLRTQSYTRYETGERGRAAVMDVASYASQDPRVNYARPNLVGVNFAIPNDPYYSRQWPLTMMKLPESWNLEKGKSKIVVAVIDSGFELTHTDMLGRFLPGIDVADMDDNVTAPAAIASAFHGQWVAGTISALTNNALGIAGVCWEGVKILPVKDVRDTSLTSEPDNFTFLSAYQYLLDYSPQPDVIVQAQGIYSAGDPTEQGLIKSLTDKGIIFLAAVGNSNFSTTINNVRPACYPEVLSIAAVNSTKRKASYSNFGKVDFAAPGGESGGPADSCLRLDKGNTITWNWTGTSAAVAYAGGAVALGLSAGIKPAKIVEYLRAGADTLGQSVPNANYGYGVIDIFKTFRAAGLIKLNITIDTPLTGAQIETQVVPFHFTFFNMNPDSLVVTVDGEPVVIEDPIVVSETDPMTSTLSTTLMLSPTGLDSAHTVEVTGTSAVDSTYSITKTALVSVVPHLLRQGRHMISVPYGMAERSPESVFGPDFRLYRWIYEDGSGLWARYTSSGVQDERASFNPPSPGMYPDGGSDFISPLGLGWFIDLGGDISVVVDQAGLSVPYDIELTPGWQLFGNPFPFDVDWSTTQFDVPGYRLSLLEAINKGFVRGELWRWNGVGYEFDVAPLGRMRAWEAHWLKVLQPCTMILKPLSSGVSRAQTTDWATTLVGTGGWLMKLAAQAGDLDDAQNFIGLSLRPGLRTSQIEKPPSVSPFVSLSMQPYTRSANMAVDIRKLGPGFTMWNFSVSTDVLNSNVNVYWNNLIAPKVGVKMVLEDTTSGKRINMLTNRSYTFLSGGKPTVRKFRVYCGTNIPVSVPATTRSTSSIGAR